MARPAYVLLDAVTGVVVKTHASDTPTATVGNTPTANSTDLENLILQGYQQKREVPLGAKVLIVLEHA